MTMEEYEAKEFERVRTEMGKPNTIFTFGSNESGIHGAGAAKAAVLHYGAEYGNGFGLQGRSYAIPTKDQKIETLPLAKVERYVADFIEQAHNHPNLTFVVTRIGCGLAGYGDRDIAPPLFKGAPGNCLLPIGWRRINGEAESNHSNQEAS